MCVFTRANILLYILNIFNLHNIFVNFVYFIYFLCNYQIVSITKNSD